MTNYSTTEPLNETPAASFLFSAITAVSVRQIRSLKTTIERGLTILADGYTYERRNPGYYIATSPADEKTGKTSVYNIAYNPVLGVASCSCDANANLGTCKHVIGLHAEKAKIDAMCDQRQEREERRRKFEADIAAAIAKAGYALPA